MARIRMLSDDLIGKIAAGEVVERPAAAIKELVENSLDAGARRISVEIQEGGIDSFRVTDDGCGIDESDIRMAFERHATSKIRTEDDLNALDTLGFRGEALASIAAVGRVTLTTRTGDRETGIRVRNEGGQITDIQEAACAPGTSILVKELFFNVPVRRGFLKKPVTEGNAVTDLMAHLILSRPDVSFRYVNGNKLIYHSPGDGKIESAVLSVYGSQAVRTMRKAEGHQGGVLLKGFVGIGENARNNRAGENFFINGRMLRSPLLSGALEDACRERVMIGKYPICVLYLDMAPENVNVNVHPNKMEVRFRFDQLVREAVFSLVYDALQDRDAFERPVEMALTPGKTEEVLTDIIPERHDGVPPQNRNVVVETGSTVPGVRMREKPPEPVYRPVDRGNSTASGSGSEWTQTDREFPLPPLQPSALRNSDHRITDDFMPGGTRAESVAAHPAEDPAILPPDLPADLPGSLQSDGNMPVPPAGQPSVLSPDWSGRSESSRQNPEKTEQLSGLPQDLPQPMKVFGALFDTFILIEYADHLLMVDQHAVHERLLFDRMMKAYEEDRAGQEMLVPYIVPVTKKEMSVLEENQDLLERIGLTVEPFSGNEVAVRSVPVTLGSNETSAFLHEAIDELESGKTPGAEKKRAAILQMACKHAVKGGEKLTEDVLRGLVEEMIEKKVTPTCPHGRPLVVSISHTELDKKFRRIQS